MLKALTLVGALLVSILLPQHIPEAQRQQDHSNSKVAPPNPPIFGGTKCIQKSETYNIQSQSPQQDDYWVKRGVIVNSILVGLTLVIAGVGAIQARAAFINARNVANSERARMVNNISNWGKTIIPIEFVNIGRSPAGIVYVQGFVEIMTGDETLPKAPKYLRDKSNGIVFNWIKTGDELNIPNSEGIVTLTADFSHPVLFSEVKAGKKKYFIFARVRYLDGISARPKESRFCFRAYVDKSGQVQFEFAGGKPYNKET